VFNCLVVDVDVYGDDCDINDDGDDIKSFNYLVVDDDVGPMPSS